MHIHLEDSLLKEAVVTIEKKDAGRDVSLLGAFPCGTVLSLRIRVPRRIGSAGVVLRIAPDGGKAVDVPLVYDGTEASDDFYVGELDTAALCGGEESGLFYYEYLFLRGADTLFSDSIDNVHLRFSPYSAEKFRLLVYRADYRTPAWFPGGVMYHIFPDRFCRGEGEVTLRSGAVLNPDWHRGIPQYARRQGDPLPNNVFFGGNLFGVTQKLDYLASLGVTVLYLSPVFEAASNHRYDTGDYEKVDSLLGGEEAFDELIRQAHERGMRVILDGVFNHTGDDSRYFNRYGRYPEVGAYQSEHSPYAGWYTFRKFPEEYECWWGIPILPRLRQEAAECRRYFTGKNGIAATWLRRGADGWRLDVADELPEVFLEELRETVKDVTGGEGLLIGEVWENAADKVSYGKRRHYLCGRQLDSVMNYPFRNAVLAFLLHADAECFCRTMTELYASYPEEASRCLMNVLGTHDTERILTLLGDGGEGAGRSNDELACLRLDESQRALAKRRLKLSSVLQYTVFGVPSVYYGDEAGLEGYHDPFCRMPFPWGEEDSGLLAHYRALGKLRREHPALAAGDFRFLFCDRAAFAYERRAGEDRLRVYANMGEERTEALTGTWVDALSGEESRGAVTVGKESFAVLQKKPNRRKRL